MERRPQDDTAFYAAVMDLPKTPDAAFMRSLLTRSLSRGHRRQIEQRKPRQLPGGVKVKRQVLSDAMRRAPCLHHHWRAKGPGILPRPVLR
jgi:hypothetical protein